MDVLQAPAGRSRASVRNGGLRALPVPDARRPLRDAAGARSDRDRRGRRLLPARHRRAQLRDDAREDVDRGRGDRPDDAAASLLPQRGLFRALGRRLPRGLAGRRTPRDRPAAVHRGRQERPPRGPRSRFGAGARSRAPGGARPSTPRIQPGRTFRRAVELRCPDPHRAGGIPRIRLRDDSPVRSRLGLRVDVPPLARPGAPS